MGTLFINIDLPPPARHAESAGDAAAADGDQLAKQVHQQFLDVVSPYFKSLPKRPSRRAGNVFRVELLGPKACVGRYILLVNTDIGEGGIARELEALLPSGSRVSLVGDFESLQEWRRT